MQITSMPLEYQGAFGELVYKLVDANPNQPIEVSVIDHVTGKVLGIKRLHGQQQYDINIAPYMRRMLDPQPVWQSQSRISPTTGRTATGKIKIGVTTTEPCTFTAGIRSLPSLNALSDAPRPVTLGPGEIDEVSIMGRTDEPARFYVYLIKGDEIMEMLLASAMPASGDMFTMIVNHDHIVGYAIEGSEFGSVAAYDAVQVVNDIDGRSHVLREYRFVERGPHPRRLCWVNPYGALDYYTFHDTGRSRVVSEKSRVYTDGYEVCDTAAQHLHTVRSEWESAEVIKWLSGVVTSPRVWLCDGSDFSRVDVVTGEVELTDDRPAALTLTLREQQRIEYQRF